MAGSPARPRGAAERHFKAALALGLNDNFLVAAGAENWLSQRKPRDALILLEAARAARNPVAAAPVLEWLERTGFEHPRMRRLAAELR